MNTMFNVPARRLTCTALLALAVLTPSQIFAGTPTINDGKTRISSNENPFGFSPKALERMKAALDSGNYYNRNDVDDLVTLLATYNGVKKDYILPTAGSGPVLDMTAHAFAAKGKNVVTTAMGYTQLVEKFKGLGGDVKYAPLSESMGYDFKALGKLIDANTAIVYICNPNNPTGTLTPRRDLDAFIRRLPATVSVLIDEAYHDYIGASSDYASFIDRPIDDARVIVARSFSKIHGLAGLRVGYAITAPRTARRLAAHRLRDNLNVVASMAAIAALDLDPPPRILITGSLYLAGEVLAANGTELN